MESWERGGEGATFQKSEKKVAKSFISPSPDRLLAHALEAFSKHPVVKRTDAPGSQLTVAEFLRHVRRMVVAFVVNRLFAVQGEATATLDDPHHLLPAPPQRLRPGRRARRRLHPLRPFVQRLGRGLGGAVGFAGKGEGGGALGG